LHSRFVKSYGGNDWIGPFQIGLNWPVFELACYDWPEEQADLTGQFFRQIKIGLCP